jgi:ATP-dependent helicase/nuclease subunit A
MWRWRKAGPETIASAPASAAPVAHHDVPEWLRKTATPQTAARHAISPSRALGAAKADAQALARGHIVHRLLQALPALPPERRAEAAQRTLARTKFEDRDAIVCEVLKLLDDPRLAALFAPGSRAEVPIVGTLPDGRRVSGQLDRLAVTANEVLIADYKSNRTIPGRIADIPSDYISQLALYRAVLMRLYPNHAVRAVLVWTAGPALTELPGAALDAAMSSVPAA